MKTHPIDFFFFFLKDSFNRLKLKLIIIIGTNERKTRASKDTKKTILWYFVI